MTPLLLKLPLDLLCSSCGDPAQSDLMTRNGLEVRVACDCGRTSFYRPGDYVRTIDGAWAEIAPNIHD